MRITVGQLKQIIAEEVSHVLREGAEPSQELANLRTFFASRSAGGDPAQVASAARALVRAKILSPEEAAELREDAESKMAGDPGPWDYALGILDSAEAKGADSATHQQKLARGRKATAKARAQGRSDANRALYSRYGV